MLINLVFDGKAKESDITSTLPAPVLWLMSGIGIVYTSYTIRIMNITSVNYQFSKIQMTF